MFLSYLALLVYFRFRERIDLKSFTIMVIKTFSNLFDYDNTNQKALVAKEELNIY